MLKKIQNTIDKYNMLQSGDKVVVAVSGGPDSLVLLHVLYQLRKQYHIQLLVAHYNHLLRQDARQDADFVGALADKLKLPFYLGEGNVAQYAKDHKLSIQVAARDLRYQFLDRIVTETGSQKLALAHQLDDQGETVVMHFLRGPSPRGLAGIPPVRGKIIRPLIEVSRQEIEEYLKDNRLKALIDASNLKTVYLRNRVRLELMPVLKKYNPNLVVRLSHGAEIFREEDRYLAEETDRQWAKLSSWEQGKLMVNFRGYDELPLAIKRRLLRKCYREVAHQAPDLSFPQVERVIAWLENPTTGKRLQWPQGVRICFNGKDIVFYHENTGRSDTEPGSYTLTLNGPGQVKLPQGKLVVEWVDKALWAKEQLKTMGPWSVLVDGDKVAFPLTIRTRKPGDRFFPLGLGGSKKLKDFFIDLKLPSEERDRVPIVVSSDGEIIWVVGLRLDERFKVTGETQNLFCFSYITRK